MQAELTKPGSIDSCVVLFATLAFCACGNEESAWVDARQANAIDAYETFLADHPESAYADSAQGELSQLMWLRAAEANDQAGYESYYNRFPEGEYSEEARLRSLDFDVRPVKLGRTTVTEDGFHTEEDIRYGPVVDIEPRWESMEARLSNRSVYGINAGRDTVSILYVVPIRWNGNNLREGHEPGIGSYGMSEFAGGPFNTFESVSFYSPRTRRDGSGVSSNETRDYDWTRVFFNIEFNRQPGLSLRPDPFRVGFVFMEDMRSLREITVLGHKFEPEDFGTLPE